MTWLLVILFRVYKHKASWAVERLVLTLLLDPGNRRSEPSRQIAVMSQPTSHREQRRVAHKATKDTTRGKHGTSNPAAAGRSLANDRMDVTQSSASETDSTDAGSTD